MTGLSPGWPYVINGVPMLTKVEFNAMREELGGL